MLGTVKKNTNFSKQTNPEKLLHSSKHCNTATLWVQHSVSSKAGSSHSGVTPGSLTFALSPRDSFKSKCLLFWVKQGCQNQGGLLTARLFHQPAFSLLGPFFSHLQSIFTANKPSVVCFYQLHKHFPLWLSILLSLLIAAKHHDCTGLSRSDLRGPGLSQSQPYPGSHSFPLSVLLLSVLLECGL